MPEAPPWSGNQLRRLGKCIRDGTPPPPSLPKYDDVMAFYNDLAVETQSRIELLDFKSLLGSRPYEVTSRSKTIDTLRQKLQRDTSTPLPSVQDVAGVRFEAEMSLDEQDAVANAIVGCFGHRPEAIHDLRSNPHSGYRAVHVWLRLPERVEVQIRTHLQGEWANLYEVAADIFGREIRYDELPKDPEAASVVASLHEISLGTIQSLEMLRNELGQLNAQAEDLQRYLGGLSRKALRRVSTRKLISTYQQVEARLETSTKAMRAMEESVRTGMLALTNELVTSNSVEGISWPDS